MHEVVTAGIPAAPGYEVFIPFEANGFVHKENKKQIGVIPNRRAEKKNVAPLESINQNHLQCHFSVMALFHHPQLHVN